MLANSIRIETITINDIDSVKKLQPEGWGDIIPFIRFYTDSPFCFPVKFILDNEIAGTGTGIKLDNTAWLAHIIVSPNHRNKGIGLNIVKNLLKILKENKCGTVSLIATDLGYPVYKKAGFIEQTDYIVLERNGKTKNPVISKKIAGFTDEFEDVYSLDKLISGEERKLILKDKLGESYLYKEKNKVCGFYIPGLWEGLIIAENETSGTELMKLRMQNSNKFSLPINNSKGIKFLKENGFAETKRFKRMIYGNEFKWNPQNIYNRIAGNLG